MPSAPRRTPAVTTVALSILLASCAPSLASRDARTMAALPAGTVIVSNMNDHTATLIDAATGRVRATLPTGHGPHEVAASRDGRWAFVSNYGDRTTVGSTITVIDVARAEVVRTLAIAGFERPHGMAFLPGDTLVAVTAERSRAVLVVDARDGRVLDTLTTGARASHMVALSADGRVAATANIADDNVSVIDPSGAAPVRLIRVGRTPEGIALTPDGRHAWVGSNRDSTVTVVDLERGATIDTLRGYGMPYRIAISPDGRTAVISDPVLGEVRVVSTGDRTERARIVVPRDSVVATAEVPGSPSPEGVAISPDSRWAFVTLQGRNRVITIDLARGTITAWAPTGTWSDGVAFSPLTGAAPE